MVWGSGKPDTSTREGQNPTTKANSKKEGKTVNSQIIATRGNSLKRIGLGILSASLVSLATACTTFVVPAPVVAPVPTTVAISAPILAPSASVRSQSHQLLEMFRYTGQPALVATPRTLEFFRYTTLADDNAAPTRSIQPLEMFRYSEQLPDRKSVV